VSASTSLLGTALIQADNIVLQDQHGGIVKMPPDAPIAAEQVMGSGMTAYFFVDSIEEVSYHRVHYSLHLVTVC